MSPPPSGKPLPFHSMFAASAIAACVAEAATLTAHDHDSSS
eukprot:gene2628-2598_t